MQSKIPKTTLEQWATLQAVAEQGGFEQAGEALNRSQSSVSYTLKKLQDSLPVQILKTQGRRTRLTDAGTHLLQRAASILEEMRRLDQLAQVLAEGWESEVRLAADSIVPPELLIGALASFSARAPQTRVQLIESVLAGTGEALLQRAADLAITGLVPPGFIGDPLIEVEFVAVAAADHPLHRLGRPITLEDLRLHRQVVIRDSGRHRQLDAGWLGAEERWTVSHLRTAIVIIERGLAFAWIPTDYIRDQLAGARLLPLPLEHGGRRPATLYLVYADVAQAGPATRTLARLLGEHATSLRPQKEGDTPSIKPNG